MSRQSSCKVILGHPSEVAGYEPLYEIASPLHCTRSTVHEFEDPWFTFFGRLVFCFNVANNCGCTVLLVL
jgi:hypothetical protein